MPPATSDSFPVGSGAAILGIFAVLWDWGRGKEWKVVDEDGGLEAFWWAFIGWQSLSLLQQMRWH